MNNTTGFRPIMSDNPPTWITAAVVTRMLRKHGYPRIKGHNSYLDGSPAVAYYLTGEYTAAAVAAVLTELGYVVERRFSIVYVQGRITA